MNKRTNNDCDEYMSIEPFMLTGKPVGIEYSTNIDEAFSHPKQFEHIVYALDNASESDVFTLNLTTPGGRLDAVLPLLGAMENTQAHVHVHACSDVASAGTFLLMRADSVSMNEWTTVMCHNVSFGSGGSGWNVEKHVEHTLKASKRLLRDVYQFFFSEAEINQMLTGTDFYMDREEFVERYQKRSELMEAALVAAVEESEQAETKPARKPRVKKLPKEVVDTIPEL